jgi:hypothetical protein
MKKIFFILIILSGLDSKHPAEKRQIISIETANIKHFLEHNRAKKERELSAIRMKLELIKRYPDFNETLQPVAVTPSELQEILLDDPANVYEGATFGPHLEGDKLVGYRVAAIEPQHFFFILGLRSSDIIKRIQGKQLSDTEAMLQVWKHMRKVVIEGTADALDIEIERNGKIRIISVRQRK